MRLICGLLRRDGQSATAATLDRMVAAMTAPGLSPRVTQRLSGALGLAVLDFTGAPAALQAGDGWTVAADARLDRAEGPAEAAVAAALRRDGADFPDHLDGDFAVALWRPDRQELWLGRDFIGARPLAWTWRDDCFAFASLPKGLHGAGMASATIDPVALGIQLSQQFFHGAGSGFAAIAYLPAGHSLCVRPGDAGLPEPHRAFRPDPARVGRWRGSPEAAAERLRDLVRDAVLRRLPPGQPVACHLSGGLDSSAITVLAARAARAAGGRVLALSMASPQAVGPPELDERPMIAAVLAQEPDIAHALVHDMPPMPDQAEDPDWPGSLADGPDDRMMREAAAFGARRLLSGVGGDEGATYNGAHLYGRLLLEGRLRTLSRELPARARRDGVPLRRAILARLAVPLIPDFLWRWLKRRPGVMDPRLGAVRYLSPALREAVLARRMLPILRRNSPAERVRAFADHHIPSRCAFHAIMGARHGVAPSFPLLDRQVVEFMLSLPTPMFLADGQTRQPFRRAMAGILPDRVRLSRHKVGLFDGRFLHYADRRAALLARLATLRGAAGIGDLFDLDAIEAGLSSLPVAGRGEGHVRAAPGGLAAGQPAWVPLLAVAFLIAACRLSGATPAEKGS
ncbi:hypothetical protein G3576_29675 [Roseomonas stagni]|uniref:asparagine synthase (glutamine-hydrolyzing) n=1 Tax=Falsiroseomonas algicola TaxID=2716930 RepID=A0A6M1LUN8_9PROT|nr:asparagine synthase-related protein [Falsiroseomonas algicola]NGM24196.1 hypothetical protein [Falsiroseomonas algicola]